MSNESLEQRARELLAAEFVKDEHTAAAARRLEADNATPVEQAAIAAIIRALESTPAQEVVDCETCSGVGTVDELLGGHARANPEAKCPDCKGTGEQALSARTAPAEGEVDIHSANYEAGFKAGMRFEGKHHLTATTAPVVGDDHATDEEIAEWMERHDLTAAIRGGDARCAFEDAQTFAMTKTTARPAKAEGDALVVKLQALVEKWRTASDGAHEEGGHYHAGEVVAYDQCADELENTYHTARTVKAEGDAQDAARYRFARNNMQIAFLNPYRWFPNPLGLDAAIDAAMQEDTARTVSRGDA